MSDPPSEPRSLSSLPQRDSELPSISTAPVAPATQRGRRVALAVLLLLAFLGVAYMAAPLWVGLVLGTVMGFTAQPMYRRLATRMGERKVLASLITTFVGGLLTLAGITLAVYIVWRELVALGALVRDKLESGEIARLIPGGDGKTSKTLEMLGLDREAIMAKVRDALGAISTHAAEAAGVVFSTATGLALAFVIALFTMYYVLLEWPKIALRLERLLPLDPRHTRALMLEFRDVGRSAFIGSIATAIVQGTLAGIGFAVAGVPQPITWGVLTALGSFLPVVGTSIVWIPVGIYLVGSGHALWGLFVFLWGALVVMAVSDYVIRPRLVGSKGGEHPLLMLIALLGGIEVFGLAGLVVGPVLMSLFLAIMRIYEREVTAASATAPPPAPTPRDAE